jgi:hypothetical protein
MNDMYNYRIARPGLTEYSNGPLSLERSDLAGNKEVIIFKTKTEDRSEYPSTYSCYLTYSIENHGTVTKILDSKLIMHREGWWREQGYSSDTTNVKEFKLANKLLKLKSSVKGNGSLDELDQSQQRKIDRLFEKAARLNAPEVKVTFNLK